MVRFDVLSKKWTGKILESIKEGPKRFNEVFNAISTKEKRISSRTLSNRLDELEKEGIITREVTKTRPPRTIYSLTYKGREVLKLKRKLVQL